MIPRRANTLRIRAPDRSLLARGRFLIEDGLRTASLPGVGQHGVLFVRRLDLGIVQADACPTTVGLAVERALRAEAVAFRDANQREGSNENGVYFPDPVAPLVALVARLVEGRDCGAWFWPLAVEGFTASASREAGLRRVLVSAGRLEAPVLGLAAVVRSVAELDGLDLFLDALSATDADALLSQCGWPSESLAEEPRISPAVGVGAGTESDSALFGSASVGRALGDLVDRVGPQDRRVRWVATVLAVAAQPSRVASTDLPRSVVARLRALGESNRRKRPNVHLDASARHPASRLAHSANDPLSTTPPRVDRDGNGPRRSRFSPPLGGSRAEKPVRAALSSSSPRDASSSAIAASVAEFADGRVVLSGGFIPSARAGVWLALSLLDGLGFGDWLGADFDRVEAQIAERTLLAIGERFRWPADDPTRCMLLEELAGTDDAWARVEFEAAASWSALGLTQGSCVGVPAVVAAWVRAARLAARRWARLPLHRLVKRAAQLRFTRTHVDVFFTLDQVDLRVRRAGLDLDPGYVPWLGKVVHFHYGARIEAEAQDPEPAHAQAPRRSSGPPAGRA